MLSRDAKWGYVDNEGRPHEIVHWGLYIVSKFTQASGEPCEGVFHGDPGKYSPKDRTGWSVWPGNPNWRLMDAPAPKASGTDWIVRWEGRNAISFTSHETALAWVRGNLFAHRPAQIAIVRLDWTEGEGLP